MTAFLTTASTMTCPHGGTVTATTGNRGVRADGGYILRSSDTFSIAGCTFSNGTSPSPCAQIVWASQSLKNAVGDPVLNQDSVGLCFGPSGLQGSVVVQETQAKGAGE